MISFFYIQEGETIVVNAVNMLQMKNITKRFTGTLEVNNVSFDAKAGEVHALMGENGAGKSTLMKILAGSFDDYTGQIFIHGKEVALHSPAMSIQHGIGMIYQELSLAMPITIAENVLVGRLPVKRGLFLMPKQIITPENVENFMPGSW